jgi:hypothetical protein
MPHGNRVEFGRLYQWNETYGFWETTSALSGCKVLVIPPRNYPSNQEPIWIVDLPALETRDYFTGKDAEQRAFYSADTSVRPMDY